MEDVNITASHTKSQAVGHTTDFAALLDKDRLKFEKIGDDWVTTLPLNDTHKKVVTIFARNPAKRYRLIKIQDWFAQRKQQQIDYWQYTSRLLTLTDYEFTELVSMASSPAFKQAFQYGLPCEPVESINGGLKLSFEKKQLGDYSVNRVCIQKLTRKMTEESKALIGKTTAVEPTYEFFWKPLEFSVTQWKLLMKDINVEQICKLMDKPPLKVLRQSNVQDTDVAGTAETNETVDVAESIPPKPSSAPLKDVSNVL